MQHLTTWAGNGEVSAFHNSALNAAAHAARNDVTRDFDDVTGASPPPPPPPPPPESGECGECGGGGGGGGGGAAAGGNSGEDGAEADSAFSHQLTESNQFEVRTVSCRSR